MSGQLGGLQLGNVQLGGLGSAVISGYISQFLTKAPFRGPVYQGLPALTQGADVRFLLPSTVAQTLPILKSRAVVLFILPAVVRCTLPALGQALTVDFLFTGYIDQDP